MSSSGADDPSQSAADQLCRRVRDLRSQNRWSLERLSTASGVSRSMLSQIERGRANPTLAVTLKIAEAFGVSLGELVGETTSRASSIEVIRADNPAHHYRSDEHCRIRTLSPLNLEKDVELYEVQLAPTGLLNSAAHFQGTREFLTVEKGRVAVRSGDEEALLGRGDSATYAADVPHAIENAGRGQAVVFLVVIYR
ncbi:MAG: XRE family transcriptional regulator [Planctomycetota bacterium]|nr:MAG: XRE family transcriptional regulator [Planctomycetota bacterium]